VVGNDWADGTQVGILVPIATVGDPAGFDVDHEHLNGVRQDVRTQVITRAATRAKGRRGLGAVNLPRIAIRYDGSSLRTHDPVVRVTAPRVPTVCWISFGSESPFKPATASARRGSVRTIGCGRCWTRSRSST
jgi:hypothetical protein